MIPLEEALDLLQSALQGLSLGTEVLHPAQALGRVLARDQFSLLDLPPFDKSAMDGYALLEGEEAMDLRLSGTVRAGQGETPELRAGEAVKVMTGAPVPPGTGRVVMREWTEEEDGRVRILRPGGPSNICRKGEDVKKGDLVLPAGTRITPAAAANLVSCGIVEVEVHRPPRVEVLATGDEVVDSPGEIRPGRIMNSNGPMLAALARRWGMEVTGEGILRDDPEETERGIARALERADFVVLSGGVSEGDFDYVPAALEKLGVKILFDRVAIKPGKPMTLGRGEGPGLLFGLPGNPVSSFLMFHLFVQEAAARLTGERNWFRELRLPLARPFRRKKRERLEFVPARIREGGEVEPLEYHGSAHLAALREAEGFLLVPRGTAALEAGEIVTFRILGGWRP